MMRRILVTCTLLSLLLPFTADAAIAFGAALGTANTTASYTSIAVSGSNTVGIVVNNGDVGACDITGVTWGGSAMTKIAQVINPSNRCETAWCINTPSSAATIALTGGTDFRSYEMYYTGATCPPVDGSNTGTASAATALSISWTVTAANSWAMEFQADGSGGKTYSASGAISTMRVNADAGGMAYGDSNGVASTGSVTATLTAVGSTNHGGVGFSIKPFVAAAANTFQLWPFATF